MSTRTRRNLSVLLVVIMAGFVIVQGYLFNEAQQSQRQLEQEREAQLKRTRLLLYASPDPLIMCSDERRITAVNLAAADLLGWRPFELVGQSIAVLVAGNDEYGRHSEAFDNVVAKLIETGDNTMIKREGIEGVAVKKTGEKLDVIISVSGIHYSGHVEFVASVRQKEPIANQDESVQLMGPDFDTQNVKKYFPSQTVQQNKR